MAGAKRKREEAKRAQTESKREPAEEMDAASTRDREPGASARGTAGDLMRTAEEDEKKLREPSSPTEVADTVDACSRRETASSTEDAAGAGDGKLTAEEDGRKPITKTRQLAKLRQRPSVSTTEEEDVTAQLQQRKHIEETLAERYSVPVSIFSVGSSSDLALVGSLEEFQQAARTWRHFYIMPYLPPQNAVYIKSKMEKEKDKEKKKKLQSLLMNPDVLSSKASLMEAIDSEIRKSRVVLDQEDPEERARADDRHSRYRIAFDIALDIIQFRSHMQDNLDKLSAHASSEKELSQDLLRVLSLEDWNGQLHRSRCLRPSQRIDFFKKQATEPSLLGAYTTEMAITALKKLLQDLISCAVQKGYLAHETGACLVSKDGVKKLRKAIHDNINLLLELMQKRHMDFAQVTDIVVSVKQHAAELGALGLKSICDALLESCKKRNDKECRKMLPMFQHVCSETRTQLEKIVELEDFILLVERSTAPELEEVKP